MLQVVMVGISVSGLYPTLSLIWLALILSPESPLPSIPATAIVPIPRAHASYGNAAVADLPSRALEAGRIVDTDHLLLRTHPSTHEH